MLKRSSFFATLTLLAAGHEIVAAGNPAFLITQGTKLYRYESGVVDTFQIPDIVAGMTTVPAGMTVGNMNGGASAGDAIAIGNSAVYRIDTPLGTPTLTQIGLRGTGPNASPVFVNGRMFGIGGVSGVGACAVEWDPTTFAEIGRYYTGVYAGAGGMVNVAGTNDEFLFLEQNNNGLWHYHYTDAFSTPVATISVDFDYTGVEMYQGTMYASFALPGSNEFVFGTVDTVTGTFSQITQLDTYNTGVGDIGQTGLTWVVPEPATVALLGAAMLVAARRRRD